MVKRIVSTMLTVCVIISCLAVGSFASEAAVVTSDYGLVDNVQYGQILQCWNWSFDNIRKNMRLIAEQGFSAIQTSPIQTSKESTTESYSNVDSGTWVLYQPLDLKIETDYRNALGTKKEFKAMCEEAHKYGIKVIVDTVFNHLASDMSGYGANPCIPDYLLNDPDCWHTTTDSIYNYDNRYDATHLCLTGFPDLNTGSYTVQGYATAFLKECIDAGADGFRFDAAKHIETPSDAYGTGSDFWPNVLNAATSYAQSTRGITPYYYGEILGTPGGGIGIGAYTAYMSVTDNDTGNAIREALCNGSASGACRSYTSDGAAIDKVVQWNESHDTYYADRSSYGVDTYKLNQTYAVIGSRNQVCALYLARPNSIGTTMMGEADITGWANPEVKAVNKFKNAYAGQSEYMSYSGSIVYNERGNSGCILVNAAGGSCSVSVPARAMSNGTYYDAITGNTFVVNGGTIYGAIGDTGIAVVYPSPSTASVSVESCNFRSDELKITLGYSHATNGYYAIDNGDYVSFESGDVITVGGDLEIGQSVTLKVKASGGQTTDMVTNTYTKIDADSPVNVYFDNSSTNWSSVYAYLYDSDGTPLTAWPGKEMTYDSARGYYKFEVPVGAETYKVIFTDGGSNQVPGANQDGYQLSGYTSLYQNGYFFGVTEGLENTMYFKPSDEWKSGGARFAAYIWNYNNDSNAWVDFTDEDGDGFYVAELPEGVWTNAIFGRMDSSTTENGWDYVWNQSKDQYVLSGTTCFILESGQWDKASGEWVYYDPATYVEPVDRYPVGSASEWALAGSFNDWSSSATVMTYTDDENIVETTMDLDAGTYTFKVTNGTDWLGNAGTIYDTTGLSWLMDSEDNCTLNATGGTYTFRFDLTANKLSVEYEAYPTVAIAGSFNDWSETANVLTRADGYNTTTIEIPEGTYTFKVVCNSNWYGNGGTIYDTADGWTMDSSDDCTLEASGGFYTFDYYASTNTLSVSYSATEPTEATTAPTTAATTATTAPTTAATTATTEATVATTATTTATEASMSVVVSGDWSTYGTEMTKTDDVYTTTLDIPAGTYDFKIFCNGTAYTKNATIDDTVTKLDFQAGIPNFCKLNASGGTYTFTFSYSECWLTVEYVPAETEATEVTTNYYLAGSFNGWSTTATPLTVSGSTASTTLTLDAGEYEFKIVDNGNWYGYNGTITDSVSSTSLNGYAGNAKLTATGGKYTFTYDYSTKKLAVTYTAPSVYFLAGSFNGWSTTDTVMEVSGSTATATVALTAGNYEFKVVDNGEWYGSNSTISDVTATSGITLNTTGPNVTIIATGGTYTFAYNTSSKNLVITYATETTEPTESTASTGNTGNNGWSTGEEGDNTKPTEDIIIIPSGDCTEHNYDEGKVTKAATYTAKGKKVCTCTICGDTKTVSVAKLKLKTPKVVVKSAKGKITVKYSKVTGAKGFVVKYKVNGKVKTKVFTAKKSVTKVINKLAKGNYKVQVRAFVKQNGKTAYSNWTKVKTVKVK